MRGRKRIAIIGTGDVGSQAAVMCARQDLGDLALIDIIDGLPQGTALDIGQSMPFYNSKARLAGSLEYGIVEDCDVVVISAGVPRRPGMLREDVLEQNFYTVTDVAQKAVEKSPDAVFIIVTNPVDAMAYAAFRQTGLPAKRVFGLSGVLDGARFVTNLANAAGVPFENVQATVVGTHGEGMVPLTSNARIGGKPAQQVLGREELARAVKLTKEGGGQIIGLLKNRSTRFAPAASIAKMVEAVVLDTKEILPVSCFVDGPYGVNGIFIGVPARIGANGIEEIVQLPLSDEEKASFQQAIAHLTKLKQSVDVLFEKKAARVG